MNARSWQRACEAFMARLPLRGVAGKGVFVGGKDGGASRPPSLSVLSRYL